MNRRAGGVVAVLAALAYIPPLLTAPGVVAADTKHYLYLDPARLMRTAVSLWDPGTFGGWVTHQTIGYLWPLGPWYWTMQHLGVPDWVAQRLWIGTLVFAAATGVLVLARLLGLGLPGATAAAVLYGLSPYLLDYVNRTSVLLAPWAALGWMMVATVLAARRGGWRWPALFALVVASVGGINATALVLCGLAPVLWLAHAAWVSREVTVRRALTAAARIGVLTLGASAWWIVALVVQSHYGADVLAYSETLDSVSATALASEVVRGLGYWLFYGGDVVGRWNSASTPYLTNPALVALGFTLVVAAVLALVAIRWRERIWLAALVLVGLVVSVGVHPYDAPSPFGAVVRDASRRALVLALRSSTRAAPLVLLALALAVGAAITAVHPRRPAASMAAALAVVVLAAANLPTLWNGSYVDALLRRPSAIPAYWHDVADALSASNDGTRALELPGAEFAAYRWGTTTDPILPGLTDRPTLTRDLLPLGGAATMDLLDALDNRFQNGVAEPAAIAPVARLLGAGAIVYRGDTAYERYRTARPEPTWSLYENGAPGLGTPVPYGPPAPNRSTVEDIDEEVLSDPRIGQPVPPAAIVPVEDPTPIVRARDASDVTVVDGSGDGLVDAAAAGLLDDPGIVLAPGAFAGDADALRAAIPPGAPLIVTDTNRKRAEQWRGSQQTTGFTEDAGTGVLVDDPADNRLPVFPGAGTATQTLAEQLGGAHAVASAYGEPNAYRPEDRADQAIDGNPTTAWQVGDRGDVIGQRLRIELAEPRPIDHLTVVQPLDRLLRPVANRWITRLTVRTAAGAVTADLTDASRTVAGQRIDLPPVTSDWVELEVAATNTGGRASNAGLDAVGLAEVKIDGVVRTEEVVRPPTDLIDALGAATASHPLTFVLTRERVDEHDRWRDDPEPTLRRIITLPAERTFSVSGTVHLTTREGDAEFAMADVFQQPPDAVASSVLAGSLASFGRAAVDGDPATTWQTAFGGATGASVGINPGRRLTVDHLDLQIVNDGRHSVPTSLFITAGGRTQPVALPHLPEQDTPVPVSVSFPAVTGADVTVTIATIDPRTTVDRRTGEAVELPTAIAELGIPGYVVPPLPATFESRCLDDRLSIDGTSVPFRLRGTTAAALAGEPLAIEPCQGPITLAVGEHIIRTAQGPTAVDRVVLNSPLGNATPAAPDPVVRVTANDPTHRVVEVSGATRPFWLVLGESRNAGWHATADGHDLGPSRLVDGGANGWLITPHSASMRVELTWQPQRWVDAGLIMSALVVAGCIVLVVIGDRRRPPPAASLEPPELTDPITGSGEDLPWPATIAVAAGGALVTGLVVHPIWAVPVGVAIAVAARWSRGRVLLTGGAVTGLSVAGLFYVARIVHSHPAPGFGWVSAFEAVHRLTFVAVLLAVADAVVAGLRARARSRRATTSVYDDPARHD